MNGGTPRLRNIMRQKEFQATLLLIFNSFSWYFPLFVFFTDTVSKMHLSYAQSLIVFGLHYIAIAGSAVIGNRVAEKIGRNKLLLLWITTGVCSSASMLLINLSGEGFLHIVSFLLGISLGLGFPSCLAFFGDNSTTERRGLIGGVTFSLTFVAIFATGFLTTLTDFTASVLMFTFWRLIGLMFFLYLKPNEKNKQTKTPYFTIVRKKSFLLYFVPWTMFCVINFFQAPFFDTQLQQQYLETNLSYIISIGEFGIGGVSMLIGGFLSDRIGRKRLIISAYGMVGVGYALLSFASQSSIVFYLYVLLDGIAWGMFFLMFLLVTWGDLAGERMKNRYYLIGCMPFILSSYITPIITPYIGAIPPFAAFSLASFFLFLAVIPLMYAPETLPEKVMKDKDLKSYTEKALKKAQKEAEKSQKKTETEKESEKGKEELEESPEDAEARKLAEKYY